MEIENDSVIEFNKFLKENNDQYRREISKIILAQALKNIENLGCSVYWEDEETGRTGRIDSSFDATPYKLKIRDGIN